ncbi:MAG: glycosyltransferase family 4 protein [Planctomycetota bacterium]|jgi:glycosyltransferase involved in cell wall biosynthesis
MKSVFDLTPAEAVATLKNQPLDLAVVHLVLEGIRSKGGGNATVIRGHIDAYPAIQKALAAHDIRITPYVAEIPVADSHPLRDRESEARYIPAIEALGGEFGYLADYTFGLPLANDWSPQLGQVHQSWYPASASGASLAINWGKRHDATLLFGNDCMFAMSPVYASMAAEGLGMDLMSCWIAHSSSFLHELPRPNPERFQVESAVVQWSKVQPHVKIGVISDFMGRHLAAEFGARDDTLAPTGNGVDLNSPLFRQRTQEEIKPLLEKHGVPLDRPLAMTWGRPVPYKRLDLLLKACKKIEGEYYPVVIAHPVNELLLSARDELDLDCALIDAYDFELVAALLQWEYTLAACILSFNEPCGIVPMEARALARQNGPVLVVTDTGGLPEQVEDGKDGFVVKQDDAEALASVLKHIKGLDDGARARIREQGYETVRRKYTWKRQILRTLSHLVPHVRSLEKDLSKQLGD